MANIPYTFSEATEPETMTKNTATGTKKTPPKPFTDDPDATSDPTAKPNTTTYTTNTTSSEKSTQTGLDHSRTINLITNSTSSGLELRPYLALIIAVLVI